MSYRAEIEALRKNCFVFRPVMAIREPFGMITLGEQKRLVYCVNLGISATLAIFDVLYDNLQG